MRVRAGDQSLQSHLENSAANTQYVSPAVQNSLLDAARQLIKESIIKDVSSARIWAIMADETADRNKQELMVIVLRYVLVDDTGRCRIHESPILLLDVLKEIERMLTEKFGSTDVELRSTGVNVGQVLLKKINELGLDKNALVGQGYDGAAYMSSEAVGAAAEVRKEAPLAVYFHRLLWIYE